MANAFEAANTRLPSTAHACSGACPFTAWVYQCLHHAHGGLDAHIPPRKHISYEILQCTSRCVEKFMNTTARVGVRFGEFFSEMEKQAAEQMQAMQAQAQAQQGK